MSRSYTRSRMKCGVLCRAAGASCRFVIDGEDPLLQDVIASLPTPPLLLHRSAWSTEESDLQLRQSRPAVCGDAGNYWSSNERFSVQAAVAVAERWTKLSPAEIQRFLRWKTPPCTKTGTFLLAIQGRLVLCFISVWMTLHLMARGLRLNCGFPQPAGRCEAHAWRVLPSVYSSHSCWSWSTPFLSRQEFAIIKVRASQIELLVQAGSRTAKMGQYLISHLDASLSTIQLGITLTSLGLGWIGEPIVAKLIIEFMHLGWPGSRPGFGRTVSPCRLPLS